MDSAIFTSSFPTSCVSRNALTSFTVTPDMLMRKVSDEVFGSLQERTRIEFLTRSLCYHLRFIMTCGAAPVSHARWRAGLIVVRLNDSDRCPEISAQQ